MEEKIYTLGGEQLSDEQKESVKKFTAEQETKTQELAKKQMETRTLTQRATLDQVLKTRVEPMEDRVVIWPDPVAEMTDSGLHKPNEVIERERPSSGTVIAVGPGKKIEESVTNFLLLNLLQFGSDISDRDLEKLKDQVKEVSIPLYPGMKVFYGRLAGTPIPDPETKEELLIMRPNDIFAKITE